MVVFLNFSDKANPHRPARFSSRVVRVFLAISLDTYGPHTKLREGTYGSQDNLTYYCTQTTDSKEKNALNTSVL